MHQYQVWVSDGLGEPFLQPLESLNRQRSTHQPGQDLRELHPTGRVIDAMVAGEIERERESH